MGKVYMAIPIALAILLAWAKLEINTLQSRLHSVSMEAEVAKLQLAKQNNIIRERNIELERAKRSADQKIFAVRAESEAMKMELAKELAQDSSCENRLNLIDRQLRIFYEQEY